MTAGRVRGRRSRRATGLLAAPLAIGALAGCAHSGTKHIPSLAKLPLAPGTAIVAQSLRCDKGANAYCALELVVVDHRFKSSTSLVHNQHNRLIRLGWSGATADTTGELAADSPGHKFRVTYATAAGDLKQIDLGVIKRSRKITLALSRTLFARQSAMSLLLEFGAG